MLVEDEVSNRNAVKRVLRTEEIDFLESGNGSEALEVLERHRPDLILLDISMPVMDGYGFLKEFRSNDANRPIPVCVMTASSDDVSRLKAIDLGADNFIAKPVDPTELRTRVKSMLRIGGYQKQLNQFNATLETQIEARTRELTETVRTLAAARQEILLAHRETVLRLTAAAEFKDKCTAAHLSRMSHYSAHLAVRCGWSAEDSDMLLSAAKMHDIGKLGIPDAILNKPGKLTPEEFAIMKRHPRIGADILAGSASRLLQLGAEVAQHHHERFDGSGYPCGLVGKQIPEVARIVAIANVFDALMTKRCYKPAWSLEDTLTQMRAASGSHFDPALLDLFLENVDDLKAIHDRFADQPERSPGCVAPHLSFAEGVHWSPGSNGRGNETRALKQETSASFPAGACRLGRFVIRRRSNRDLLDRHGGIRANGFMSSV